MLLLPAAAVDRNAPAVTNQFSAFLRKENDVSSLEARDFLIKEGAKCGDYLHFHSSGDTFHSVYKLGHKIGEGGFGKVFVATHTVLGISRAVKRLLKSQSRCEFHANELNALLALDHPHIVKLIEYYDEDEYLYLVFELCEGVALLDCLQEQPTGRFNEYDASVALRHMLKALQCCHSHYRGHYDIKPENFMYKHKAGGNLKMVDLGLSSAFDMQRRHRVCGTSPYMAPEFWDGIYGPEGDVWSCGVVLFVMLTGHEFLDDVPGPIMKREVRARKLLSERLEFAANKCGLSAAAQDLLRQMLNHDRHARPTIKEALKHPFNRESYDVEKRSGTKSAHDFLLIDAHEVLHQLLNTMRKVMKEPMLKRVTRLVMVQFSEIDEARCLAFRMLDLHGYGELSISAFAQDERICKASDGSAPDDMDELFGAMDLNRDGYISYRAFLSVTLPDDVLRNNNALQVAFSILDTDKDGFIGESDLAAIFGHSDDSAVCKDTIGEVGSDGKVSWEQFLALMIPAEAQEATDMPV